MIAMGLDKAYTELVKVAHQGKPALASALKKYIVSPFASLFPGIEFLASAFLNMLANKLADLVFDKVKACPPPPAAVTAPVVAAEPAGFKTETPMTLQDWLKKTNQYDLYLQQSKAAQEKLVSDWIAGGYKQHGYSDPYRLSLDFETIKRMNTSLVRPGETDLVFRLLQPTKASVDAAAAAAAPTAGKAALPLAIAAAGAAALFLLR
jgi:hypothetical protein